MKYLISEKQYRLISEQWWNDPKHPEWKRYAPTDYEKRELKKAETTLNNLDPHTLVTIGAIGTAFIPVVGPFLSAALGASDAALYYNEGDKKSAGITAVFSMLPFLGPIVSKIPGLKQLGSKGMVALASKLSKSEKLTEVEVQLVKQIADNSKVIQTELQGASNTLKPISQTIEEFKPKFIERLGQTKYEELLQNLISKKITKEQFINTLKQTQLASPELAQFVSKYGIKFSQGELNSIHKITDSLRSKLNFKLLDETLERWVPEIQVVTKNGPKTIKVKFINSKTAMKWWGKEFQDSYGGAFEDEIYFIYDNVRKMSKGDMDQLFYHEFAHVKDPSMVSTKLDKLYKSNVARESDEYFSKGYYFHPRELVANTSKILNGLSVNTSKIAPKIGKENTLKALDDIKKWSQGLKQNFTNDMLDLLGYNQEFVKKHFEFLRKNPEELKKLLAKVAQQAEYLKSQIKLAM